MISKCTHTHISAILCEQKRIWIAERARGNNTKWSGNWYYHFVQIVKNLLFIGPLNRTRRTRSNWQITAKSIFWTEIPVCERDHARMRCDENWLDPNVCTTLCRTQTNEFNYHLVECNHHHKWIHPIAPYPMRFWYLIECCVAAWIACPTFHSSNKKGIKKIEIQMILIVGLFTLCVPFVLALNWN